MSIPKRTSVLVVGGGPGGSYAASALAREGVDCVVLEGDKFPRYHVGESMVASIRHFLQFIELDETFNNHGFVKKTGAAFKLNNKKEAVTDFVVAGGPNAYAWNVIRSESDDLMFKHAGKSGARVFDGVKVQGIQFEPLSAEDATNEDGRDAPNPGRPVSATWARKEDGSSGTIAFDYLVDASGRAGIMSTKYLKNRSFNSDLKNVASWGYWSGAIKYGIATPQEGLPFFEALQDGSGWCWFIPLHNGTVSIGVVMNQAMSTDKKKAAQSPTSKEFYLNSIQEAVGVAKLLENATLESEIKHASDWSYSASTYASPYCRIVGDAGSFIDPYFSSGVHLALSGALSAAITICASMRGHTSESRAWDWHSRLVAERYTRFLLVVMSATKQIRHKDVPIMNQAGDEGFEDAFSLIRPVIQGTADVNGKIPQAEISAAVNFTLDAVQRNGEADKVEGMERMQKVNGNQTSIGDDKWVDVVESKMTQDETRVLKMINNVFNDFVSVDNHGGLKAVIQRGSLGLEPAEVVATPKVNGKAPPVIEQEIKINKDSPLAAAA